MRRIIFEEKDSIQVMQRTVDKYNQKKYLNVNKKEKESQKVTRIVRNSPQRINNDNKSNYIKFSDNKKRKRDSNGMEPNLLIPDIIYNYQKYLNVDKKEKGIKNVIPTVRNFSLDSSNYYDNNYINFSDDKKENKEAVVASMVRHFFPEITTERNNEYINFSFNIKVGEQTAAVALMVRRSPDERDLLPRRVPGSIPGSGGSPTFQNSKKNNICEVIV